MLKNFAKHKYFILGKERKREFSGHLIKTSLVYVNIFVKNKKAHVH
jgi:hypothetical protein